MLPKEINLQLGNFLDLSYPDENYDVIIRSTVLSSILDLDFQKEVIQSYKLLKPNGIILLYDFVFNNPSNPDVKGINLSYPKKTC